MAPEYYFEHEPPELKGEGLKLCLFLDFDGTLTPIQKDPSACVLSPEVQDRLVSLAASAACTVVVLSGRPVADIKKRVPVDGLYYGGNHGLAIEGPGLSFIHSDAIRAKETIGKIRPIVEQEIARLDGPWIEDKGLTFSLHYRGAERDAGAAARKAFRHALTGSPETSLVAILRGKKVLELVPRTAWDKGGAALYILDALGHAYLPVYVGDDITDESAFSALSERGVTIRVGPSKRTAARYYLKRQSEIVKLLHEIERVC